MAEKPWVNECLLNWSPPDHVRRFGTDRDGRLVPVPWSPTIAPTDFAAEWERDLALRARMEHDA